MNYFSIGDILIWSRGNYLKFIQVLTANESDHKIMITEKIVLRNQNGIKTFHNFACD